MMMNYSITTKYTYLWNKYRPAILRLMIASSSSPQQYKFADHEFRRLNPKEKAGYTFTLEVSQGKSVNNIRTSPVAKDLLTILQQSRTALELTAASTYKFILDKKFVLHIARVSPLRIAPTNSDHLALTT